MPLFIELISVGTSGSLFNQLCPLGDFRIAPICVFFTQHLPEKRPTGLWVGPFFIAPKVPSANVLAATEGGIPMSRCPVNRIAPSGSPGLECKLGGSVGGEGFSG